MTRKILIVEDNRDRCEMLLALLLSGAGFETTGVHNGAEAIAHTRKNPFTFSPSGKFSPVSFSRSCPGVFMPIAPNESHFRASLFVSATTIQRGNSIAGVELDPFKPQKISNFQATT